MRRPPASSFWSCTSRRAAWSKVSRKEARGRLRLGGAAAAAFLGAFSFTNWQNSNETEVYAVATFTIAAMAWAAMLWRRRRHTERGHRFLLLIVYLAGISIGNHLLALLAVPGVLMFLVATLYHDPAPEPARRRMEWGQVAVLAGVWALLIGTGLGSVGLIAVGAVLFLAAAAYATLGGAGAFAAAALGLAAVGVTPYLYLYIRSAQHPIINEADPSTLDALLAVIRRAQYPPRTPFDDPTECHGPDNPGRTLALVGLQLANYFQYFDWQWARSLADGARQRRHPRLPDARPAWSVGAAALRPPGMVAAAGDLPGHRARAGGLHELQARVQPRVPPVARGGRPRGPRAGLLLRGELHRVGALGRDRRRRVRRRPLAQGEAPGRGARAAPGGSGSARAQLAQPPPAGTAPMPVSRPTSPTTC